MQNWRRTKDQLHKLESGFHNPLEVSMTEGKLPAKNGNHNLSNDVNHPESKNYRRRYSDYFGFAPVGFFTFDRSGDILNVNFTGALLLGTDRDSLLRRSFATFLSPESHDVFDSHSRRLFKTRKKQTCDVKLMNGNGRSPWVQLESVAVQNGSGDSDQFRTVINEIT
jgi:PAS domain S-box-containing protein